MEAYKMSLANSRMSASWSNTQMSWQDLLDKLEKPVIHPETQAEYAKLTKAEQDDLKDVGGFVAGHLYGQRRKKGAVLCRSIITLDLDAIKPFGTEDILTAVRLIGCRAAIYSTRKHMPKRPRLRILIPTDREMTIEEYEPAARKVAELIGIENCDPTTFELNRLMFWPSLSSDGEYIYWVQDGAVLSVDTVLKFYADWRDIGSWPRVPGVDDKAVERAMKKQGDPTEKSGIVGHFCRCYDIYQAIEKFLPGVYAPTDAEDRLTFLGGSTAGGAIVYQNGLFLYSHHATDPCSMKLVNSFDLVRLHLFGAKDDGTSVATPATKMPSYKEMLKLASSDPEVSKRIRKEREEEYARATEAFTSMPGGEESNEVVVETTEDGTEVVTSDDWTKFLSYDKNGGVLPDVKNVFTILSKDKRLSGKLMFDTFASRLVASGGLPWDQDVQTRSWSDTDDANLFMYLEVMYGMKPVQAKVLQACSIAAHKNRFNAVDDYLNCLVWDGVERLDTMLIDYLGAEDSEYTKAVTRKMMCAAVDRAICNSPDGIKFDNMVILVGTQGLGKSTLLRTLGGQWFSDSLVDFSGKDSAELIQGTWINEIGELSAMNRQESNEVKQFLSKVVDRYRESYGRRAGDYPRRCVFVGTSNDDEFLKDTTGNRRFWPVDVGEQMAKKDVWNDLPRERDQIWAEARVRAITEPLYLSKEIEAEAKKVQAEHAIQTGKEGIVLEFLKRWIPSNWYDMSLAAQKMFLESTGDSKVDGLMPRTKVCPQEIFELCFGRPVSWMKQLDTIEITRVMKNIGIEKAKNPMHFGVFGKQRGFIIPREL